jgi:hypothetical protein
MKVRPSRAAVVALVVAVAVALAFLYAVPSGRRARRETLRALRLGMNATGIYRVPVLTIKMWRGTRQGVLLVELYESGRLVVVSRRGERIERQLTRDESVRIVETGMLALGDFSSLGCDTDRGGLNAELYLLRDGAWTGSICRDAPNRPPGLETTRLFAEIESHVPGVFDGL